MRITQKGQVTIPLPIRAEFGLKPGTEVEFDTESGKVVLRKRRTSPNPVEAWLEQSTGIRKGWTTTDKIMKITRGET